MHITLVPRATFISNTNPSHFCCRETAVTSGTRYKMLSYRRETALQAVADPDISFGGARGAKGAEVERRRREDRGAEGAERGGVWGGGIPLPTGGGKFFQFLLKNGVFWSIVMSKCASHVYT